MDAPTDQRLPRILALMWGREHPQRRGPKPGLNLQVIAEAAIKIADAEGLSAVSMSRVATELGFSTMALYRYVSSKDDLVALMVDTAAGRPEFVVPAGEHWREGLSTWSHAYREVLRRHPWMTTVPISGPPIAPNELAWMDAALGAMSGTGLSPDERMSVLLLVSNYVRSATQLEVQLAAAARAGGPQRSAVMREYGRVVLDLIDPQQMPALQEIMSSAAFAADDNVDDEFEFGLQTLLDGVAARLARETA